MTGTLWAGDPETDGKRRYLIADVFTSTPLEGNALGVFPDGRGLDTALMQKTARELNLSETVFFLPPQAGGAEGTHAKIRIFTPVAELQFAGHPVLGAAFVLAGLLDTPDIGLETGAGLIPVRVDEKNDYGEMEQPIPGWEPYGRADDLLEALHVGRPRSPVEVCRNGPRHIYVALPSEEEVAALNPDITRLATHPAGVNCFAGAGTIWKTRMFAPHLGVPEDPATGSAAGPLAIYLARHGRIAFGQRIEISQGTEIGRPSTLYARVEGTKDNIEHVYVGGHAVVVAHGEYRLR